MFEARLNQGSILKKIIEAIKDLVVSILIDILHNRIVYDMFVVADRS